MDKETFLFKSEDDCEILVNDGSSFTRDIFEGANKILSSYHKLETHPYAIVCPNDYEEDSYQSEQRSNFHLAEWLLVALEVDASFEPRRALLMNKYRQEEGFVFDFILEKAIALFFRYFSIQESPDSPILLQKDFLESINLAVEQRYDHDYDDLDEEEESEENYFDFHPLPKSTFTPFRKNYNIPNFGGPVANEEPVFQEDEDDIEGPRIEVERPAFQANKNRKPTNLNNVDRQQRYIKNQAAQRLQEDEEEESEPLNIEVAKPAFAAGKKIKPSNLNAIDQNEKYLKQKAREQKIAEEMEESKDLHIEVEKPLFEANRNQKPTDLDAIDHDKKYQAKLEKEKKELEKKEIEARYAEKIENDEDFQIEPETKHIFVPPSNKKPRTIIDEPNEKGWIKIEKPADAVQDPIGKTNVLPIKQGPFPEISVDQEKEIQGEKAVFYPKSGRVGNVVVENNYKAEASFNIRPDVRHQEASLINNPEDKYSFASCSVLYESLKEIKTLRVSANCLFVPEILPSDHQIFHLAKDFKAEEWILLALIHGAEEKPLYTLMANKNDENLAIVISFRHRDPRIMIISTKGIGLNDPAYPFYSYRNLLSLVKGENPYK